MSQFGMWKVLGLSAVLLGMQAFMSAEATSTTTMVAQNSGKCLDVTGGPQATQDGAVIEQYSCTGSSNQSWELRDLGAQQYELVASNSYKCAEATQGAEGTAVTQVACSGAARQLWTLQYISDNVYQIVNVPNGLCLDVMGGPKATDNEAPIELWRCTGATNQAWGITPPKVEPRPVIAKNSGKCLDVTGGPQATQNGALLEQYTCTGAANQEWTLRTIAGGGIEFVAKNSGKCIEAIDGATANETKIQQADCTGTPQQLWTQESVGVSGAGEYRFVHKASSRCLDVTGGPQATQNGAQLELYTCTGSTNQTWTLGAPGVPLAGTRDPLKWPFSQYSIWNMPIGSGAVYVPANIDPKAEDPNDSVDYTWNTLPAIDWERIVLKSAAPPTWIYYSSAGWKKDSAGKQVDRCYLAPSTDTTFMGNGLPIQVPIPTSYVQPSTNGNEGAVFLMSNGRTLIQTQPFARCNPGEPATSVLSFAAVDLYGDGRTGAHGGSKLSSIGGSIRLGELRPGQQGMRHALKVNLYEQVNYYHCSLRSECFRWPASNGDSSALTRYGVDNNNQNRAMKMGALLAIPASVDINSLGLESEPGRQIAWTLQNYGAYIVDSIPGPGFMFSAEEGADDVLLSDGTRGRKKEQFADDYRNAWHDPRYPNDPTKIMQLSSRILSESPWTHDLLKIIPLLAVVDNNTPTSIGGGGTPRQPIAPVFQ